MTGKISPNGKAKGRIQLDWQAYFYRFIEEHGEPVESDGLLLFRDGWRYSLTDYRGPEYRPPTEAKKLSRLREIYWTLQRDKLVLERRNLQQQVRSYEDCDANTSLPLQQRVLVPQPSQSGMVVYKRGEVTDLDLSLVQYQVADLDRQIEECEEQLRGVT